MNKRSAPRFPVSLDVNVTFADHSSKSCTVRDYCAGGMYLLCEGGRFRRGDSLSIEFDDPFKSASAAHHIDAKVMRIEEHGLGVAFIQENAEAMVALSQLAASQSAAGIGVAGSAVAGETYGKEAIEQLLGKLRSRSEAYLFEVLHDFFEQARNSLFDAAGESKSNTQQAAYFGAMNELRNGKDSLSDTFIQRLGEQFDILTTTGYRNRYQQESASQSGLSLVETDELDNWLAVRAMSAKLEEIMGETLEALENRFEEISANPITLENNPVGPFVIASIFREMLNRMVLEEAPRKLLFSTMGDLLGQKLKRLYDELNEGMIAQGILPTMQKKMEVVRTPDASGYGSATAPHPEQTADTGMPVEEAPQATTGAPFGAAPGSAAPQPAAPAGSAASAAQSTPLNYTRMSQVPQRFAGAAHSAASSSGAVNELARMQQALFQSSGAVEPPPEGVFSSGQVVDALGQIDEAIQRHETQSADAVGRVSYLSDALAEATGEEGMALSDADQKIITYVGGMFSSIHHDDLVAEQARPWFKRLEVPLLKAGILDSSLLEDEAHPARELLNRLEAIGDLLQNDESPDAEVARQRIEGILNNISEKVESEPDVFADALTELEEVQGSVEENYEENVQQLIKECEQEKEINKARRSVLHELNLRLSKRDVPVVVLHLLDSGWKNLLLRAMLKNGSDSVVFKTYLNVVDLLTARLTGSPPYQTEAKMSDEELLEWIERMLSMVSSNQEQNASLLQDMRSGLAGSSSELPETRYVPALISKSIGHEQRAEVYRPNEVSEDVWSLMLEDAKQLADREVFNYRGEGESNAQVTMVWRDKNNRFVFADNLGHKALDIELGEVASDLYNKKLVRINEKELAITERATYSFLQSLHNQISYQANHDDLTGLLNRKAFELSLSQVVDEAKAGKATHVLGYFDLDRFNLINNTCGHAEGDELLKRVAGRLQELLGEDAVIARLGGDEFGIILQNSSRTHGLKQLTDVHDSIRDIRFACENNEFKVTCSMGIAEINADSDSAGRLLSAVDSATFTAKDNGRDNIQIYNIENERISSRKVLMDWVGRINVLFEKNLIHFRCQKISPLHRTINSLPHYEVLLDVHDESGNKVPLDEFIVAAERYNRITDIDVWVCNYVFDWLEQHASKLDRISHLAINLSGSSLVNRHFIDDIYQRLSRPDFPADKVCFEITENVAMSNLDSVAHFMTKLKQTGCRFSLDDFGRGTSSYSYLRSLPIDFLKIDGAFVKDIATNTSDYAVVKSINEIGHVMGKQTVAESVEDEFAYQLLSDIGIDFVQGFGVEKPIPLYKLFS